MDHCGVDHRHVLVMPPAVKPCMGHVNTVVSCAVEVLKGRLVVTNGSQSQENGAHTSMVTAVSGER